MSTVLVWVALHFYSWGVKFVFCLLVVLKLETVNAQVSKLNCLGCTPKIYSCTYLSLWDQKCKFMWHQVNHLLFLSGFLQASSSFEVKDSSGKVCIIADLTVAFSVEYKNDGQKQVRAVSMLLLVTTSIFSIYKMCGISARVQYLNFQQVFLCMINCFNKDFYPPNHVASAFLYYGCFF